MIDTSSIESFINSIPVASGDVRVSLLFEQYKTQNIKNSVIKLAKRGLLGCFIFANTEYDSLIFRLLPGKEILQSSFAVVYSGDKEGITWSPDVSNFVTGRIIQIGLHERLPSPDVIEKIISYSEEFGDTKGLTRKVFDNITNLKLIEDNRKKKYLYELISDDNLFFKMLAFAFTRKLSNEEIKDWFDKNTKEMEQIDLLWRLYLYHYMYDDDIDLTETIQKIIMQDCCFDYSYKGNGIGAITNCQETDPLLNSSEWLKERNSSNLSIPEELWQGFISYTEKPKKYDGKFHLQYAKKIADKDPFLSYTQTCNAANFYSKSKKEINKEAINFAYELAKENKWQHLETLLRWTVEGMDK